MMGYEQDLKNELISICENEMDRLGVDGEDEDDYHVVEKMRNWISNFECEGKIK